MGKSSYRLPIVILSFFILLTSILVFDSFLVKDAQAQAPTNNLYGIERIGGIAYLIQIDKTTGAKTTIGSTGITTGLPSLAIDPTSGRIYAGGGQGAPTLYILDRGDGHSTPIGDSGLGFAAIGGMDFDSAGDLYAAVNIAGDGGTGSDHLATINKFTGVATIIGPFGVCTGVPTLPVDGSGSCSIEGMEAIAFDSHEILWGAVSNNAPATAPGLYRIDTSTGSATFVAPLLDGSGNPLTNGGVVGLDFDENGIPYGSTAQSTGGGGDGGQLLRISTNPGEFTIIGQVTGGSSLTSLSFEMSAGSSSNTPPTITTPTTSDNTGEPLNSIEATSAVGAVVTYTATASDVEDGPLTPICTPASGSTFGYNGATPTTTTVNCTVTDSNGTTTNASFDVTVQDTTAPTLAGVPADATIEATSAAGAVHTYTDPTASDAVDPAPNVSCNPASGSTFAIGPSFISENHTVTCTATDASGNSANATFDVTVQDTTAPSAPTNPGNQVLEATDASGTNFAYSSESTDAVGVANITCDTNLDSNVAQIFNSQVIAGLGQETLGVDNGLGQTFELSDFISETHTVTCIANDTAGNSAQSSFTVTVQDTTAPELPTPELVTVNTAVLSCNESTNTCSTATGTAEIPFEEGSVLFFVEANGPTGTVSNYELTASDAVGPTSVECSVVSDDLVNVPSSNVGASSTSQTITGTGQQSLVLDNGVHGAGSVPLYGGLLSGQLFEIDDLDKEVHTVSCFARDTANNTSLPAEFDVILQDTVAPVVFAPINPTPVDAVGVHTPIDIELGTAGGMGNVNPEGAFVADLVSTLGVTANNGFDTFGSPEFGKIHVTNDRPAQDDRCDDGTNGGDVFSCFLAVETNVTYQGTDTGGNSASDIQVVDVNPTPIVAGWLRDDAINGFFLEQETETQIEGQGNIQVTDLRENNDARIRETLTVHVTSDSDPFSIDATLTEIGKNTGIFTTTMPITFTATGTDDLLDEILVQTGDNAQAEHLSPPVTPENPEGLSDSATITTAIVDINNPLNAAGGSATATEPIKPSSDAVVIETTFSLQIFDAARINGIPNEIVNGIAGMQSPSNQNNPPNPVTTPIGIKLTEIGDTGVLANSIGLGVSTNPSDRTNKVIQAQVGEQITFTYQSYTPVSINVIAPQVGTVALETIAPDFELRLNPIVDTDGDGLDDSWETEDGLMITHVDEVSGAVSQWFEPCDQTIPNDCPDPRRKDLYVEIDYMTFHEPDSRAIDDVVAAFAAAPVINPGGNAGSDGPGTNGVNLHVLVSDDMGVHLDLMPFNTDDGGTADPSDDILGFHDRKNIFFGTPTEKDGTCVSCIGTPEEILTLKRQAYRYGMFIHDQAEAPGSSGTGEVGGNDFIVSLGSFIGGGGTVDEQAATLMHELGHTLNLGHGGRYNAALNCKSTLISVMNYGYQFADLVPSRPLDYQRAEIPAINTAYLSESAGLPAYHYPDPNNLADPVLTAVYGFTDGEPRTTLTGIPVDFSRDGITETDPNITFSIPLNKINIPGCENLNTTPSYIAPNQWALVKYDFKDADTFASGASQRSNSGDGETGNDEPKKETYGTIFSSIFFKIINAIKHLTPAGSCDQAAIDFLSDELRRIMEIHQTGQQRKEQIPEVLANLEALQQTTQYQACLAADPTIGDLTEAVEEAHDEASNAAVTVFILTNDGIDVSKKGVINYVILGTVDFNALNILGQTLRVGDDSLTTGAPDAHFGNPHSEEAQTHFQDYNGDGIMDLRGHFRQNETGLQPGLQQVCVSGQVTNQVTLPDGTTATTLTDFNGCNLIDVIRSKNNAPALTTTSESLLEASGNNPVSLTATASDTEDGDLTGSIVWTEGGIPLVDEDSGTAGVQVTFGVGTHVVTASVTDSIGQTTEASLTISVSIIVEDEDMFPNIVYGTSGGKNADKHLNVDVTVLAPASQAGMVAGANLTLDLLLDGVVIQSFEGTTDSGGIISFMHQNAASGHYSVEIVNLTAAGFVWDGTTVTDLGFDKP